MTIIEEIRNTFMLVDREMTLDDVQHYIDAGTLILCRSKGQVILLCLFSVHGDVAHVHEMYVAPEFRHKNAIKWTAIQGLKKYPFLNEVVFERERKYPDRFPRKYDIYKLIGVKRHSEVQNG